MDRWERNGVLSAQIDQLREQGSWCGETHVQKACYFLEKLVNVPLGFDFILYRHGPFSFDLRDELAELRAVGFLTLETRPHPYGPSFVVTPDGQKLIEQHREAVDQFRAKTAFVVERLAGKNVGQLERLATALFITVSDREAGETTRAGQLQAVKPHISEADALEAIRTVDRWAAESTAIA